MTTTPLFCVVSLVFFSMEDLAKDQRVSRKKTQVFFFPQEAINSGLIVLFSHESVRAVKKKMQLFHLEFIIIYPPKFPFPHKTPFRAL